jgi:hypothetical protein
LRSGVHLVCVHNLPDVIWFSFEWKQGYWILLVPTSTYFKFPLIIKLLHTPPRFFFLHFNKFLEENLSKSPSIS